ncbi:MAG TPA: ABC transporter ATP-binding protein [Chloroflexia bacterium]|nr:ABC transporter ATP-binding protein [Chloroflexia bacterium]
MAATIKNNRKTDLTSLNDADVPAPLEVEISALHKSFMRDGEKLEVLRGVELSVPAGKFATVLGPSGSGKSTLLGIVAGLDQPDAGSVTLRAPGSDAPLAGRLGQVGYMPQRDLLLPWRTALDNAAVGLEVQGLKKSEARARALPLFGEFGLTGFANSLPHELSGGMRQRVSFLRSALVARGLMLLDEPFGGLDALTRASMQEWLLEATETLNSTFVLVTHDIDEAVLLSDRVYVLSPRPGRVVEALEIDLPRPRSLEITREPVFAEYGLRLLEALRSSGSLSVQPGARA